MAAQRWTVAGVVGYVSELTVWATDPDDAQRIFTAVQQARGAAVVRIRSIAEAPPDA